MVANTLGLNDSKYQYVIDALEADEMREKREQRDEEDRQKVLRVFLVCFIVHYLASGQRRVLFDHLRSATNEAYERSEPTTPQPPPPGL